MIAAIALAFASLAACGHVRVEVTRHEVLRPVERCQVGPMDVTTVEVADVRRLAPNKVLVAVVEDRVTGARDVAAPNLAGRRYVVERAPGGAVAVTTASERGNVNDDEARRVEALAVGVLGLGTSATEDAMARAAQTMFDPHLHDVRAPDVRVVARRQHGRGVEGGSLYGVTLEAHEADAGMCHRWTNEARLTGEAVVEPGGASPVRRLVLHGPTRDTQAVCQGDRTPRVCNRGHIAFELRATCGTGRGP